MAENRRYGLTPQLDIGQILLEAQYRWLRPTEVCEILRNYRKFRLAPDPPHKPTSSIDVLHCYYAHGEDNENFQRRSYWMLEEQYEHIVLVHYREVKEGNKAGVMRSISTDRALQIANSGGHINSSACSSQAHSSSLLAQTTYASSPSTTEWNGPTHSSEVEDGESGDDVGVSSLAEADSSSAGQGSLLRQLNGNEELVIDSRHHQDVSYLKTFTGRLAENKASYSPFNASEVLPAQYSFLGAQQSVQEHFLKHTFQNTYLTGHSKGETSHLAPGQDSLAAVRNAAQAAARIQASFRVHSFRRSQLIEYGDDKCGMSDEQALSFVSVQKTRKLGSHDEPLHTAAIRIQRKFRGWKGRKEFLIIRQRIVKIQVDFEGTVAGESQKLMECKTNEEDALMSITD